MYVFYFVFLVHVPTNIQGFLPDDNPVTGGIVCLLTPKSRVYILFLRVSILNTSLSTGGTLSITSSDPFVNPAIDLGLLTSDFDVFAIREGIKSLAHFFAAPAWKGYIVAPTGNFATAFAAGDVAIDAWIRDNAGGFAHAVGTAVMSSRASSSGVVNPDLLVKGASGLRIVDASIMVSYLAVHVLKEFTEKKLQPFVTAGHTQAPTYVIAERGADLIKSAHGL